MDDNTFARAVYTMMIAVAAVVVFYLAVVAIVFAQAWWGYLLMAMDVVLTSFAVFVIWRMYRRGKGAPPERE